MALPKVVSARRWTQIIVSVVVAAIGVQFTLWVKAHLSGNWPNVSRPPGVEAFLPIDAMLATRHLLLTGEIDPIHPAGLAIFLGICLMSVVVAKSFCSHACPVGLLSELLGRLGLKLLGRNLKMPKWLDLPLRGLKLFFLGFFAWAIWYTMRPEAVAAFLHSPYVKVADAKMWVFFASPTRMTIAVLGIITIGSIFIRDLWCRYLCPYGALVGLLGRFAPFKVTRSEDLCTGCQACTKVCPARLPVHDLTRMASIECTSCQDCVVACPVDSCLTMAAPRLPGRSRRPALKPAMAVGLSVALLAGTVWGFRAAGYWYGSVGEAEYHHRIGELDSPLYSHVGGQAMSEEDLEQR